MSFIQGKSFKPEVGDTWVADKTCMFKDWNDVVIPEGAPDLDYKVSLYRRKSAKRGYPALDATLTPIKADSEESA